MPPISLERIPTDDNSDELTRTTVHKMCALIRDSATDPLVQQCAAYAQKHFASGSSDQAALAWGVFWYVKHCVKFRSDEGTMMQVGERALDLLTAPAVLVRMKDPSEDCDGFTMLSAAMLTILGVPVLVTTVAVDLDDPRRWSHVFLCAVVNGRVMPLDTSHGKAPGWMVPRSRINRWQTWKLDGTPADVQIPSYRGLHGYVAGVGQAFNPRPNTGIPAWAANQWKMPPPPQRGPARVPMVLFPKRGVRGMGQTCLDSIDNADGTTTCLEYSQTPDPLSSGSFNSISTTACPDGQSNYGAGCVPTSTQTAWSNAPLNTPLTPAQAGLTPAQETALIAQLGTSAVSLIRTAAGGPYQVSGTNLIYNPATGMLTTAAGANQVASLLSGGSFNMAAIGQYLPLIVGGILAVVLLPSLMGRK